LSAFSGVIELSQILFKAVPPNFAKYAGLGSLAEVQVASVELASNAGLGALEFVVLFVPEVGIVPLLDVDRLFGHLCVVGKDVEVLRDEVVCRR